MIWYQFEIPTSHHGVFNVIVPENIYKQDDFWHGIDDTLDVNVYRYARVDKDGTEDKWRYVLYPVEDGKTNTNIVINSGFTLEPKKIIMSEENSKPTLNDALSFMKIAIEQIQELMEEKNKPSSNIDREKLVEALGQAYRAGLVDAAQQIEGMYFEISLDEGGFEYNNRHCLDEFICVEDEIGSFEDAVDTWVNKSVCKKIEEEFFPNDVSEKS